jgi:hypothetical protein
VLALVLDSILPSVLNDVIAEYAREHRILVQLDFKSKAPCTSYRIFESESDFRTFRKCLMEGNPYVFLSVQNPDPDKSCYDWQQATWTIIHDVHRVTGFLSCFGQSFGCPVNLFRELTKVAAEETSPSCVRMYGRSKFCARWQPKWNEI